MNDSSSELSSSLNSFNSLRLYSEINDDYIRCGYFEPFEKKGFTFADKLTLISLIIFFIIYITLISVFSNQVDLENKNDHRNIIITIIGLIFGFNLTYFIQNYIFREYEINIILLLILSILCVYIIVSYHLKSFFNINSKSYALYTQIVIPLLSTLYLLINYTIVKFTPLVSFKNYTIVLH
jgi:hypothetical protein